MVYIFQSKPRIQSDDTCTHDISINTPTCFSSLVPPVRIFTVNGTPLTMCVTLSAY